MGVQFVQMKPEDRAKLNQFLSQQLASQEAVAAGAGTNSLPVSWKLVVSSRREEAAQIRFEQELKQLIELTGKSTYYQLLGVTSESPAFEVKKSYRALARKFHPDGHMGNRELNASLKNLMALITEAYKTLVDEKKRAAYDKRLAASGAFTMRREKARAEDSLEEWFKRANECLRAKNFVGSIVWLRKCAEAAPDRAPYHAMLARSLATVPQYANEAIEHFQKAIELDPWQELVYVQFAELLSAMALPARACAIYSKLLKINPAHAIARERLAALESAQKATTLRH